MEEMKKKMQFIQGESDNEYMSGQSQFDSAEDFIAGSASFEDDMEIKEAKADATDAIKAGIADAKVELGAIKTAYKGLPTLEHKVSEEHKELGMAKIHEGISSMAEIREKAQKRREEIQQRIQNRMAEIKKLASADKELSDFSKNSNANLVDSMQLLNTMQSEEHEEQKMEEQRQKETKLTGVRAEERSALHQAKEIVSAGTQEESVGKFMESDAKAQETAVKGRRVIHARGSVA